MTKKNEQAKTVKRRKTIPVLTSKKLFQEANNCCAFCKYSDVATLEMHHINEDPSDNKIENLIVVCSNCHSKITHGEISPADVHAKKIELLWSNKNTAKPSTEKKNSVRSVSVKAANINDSIIANTVNIGRKRTPRMQYPPDSIGADVIKKGYIDYLVKRYYDYRKADASYGNFRPFNHAEIHTTIHSKFKAKTFFIHVVRFNELSDYLKSRIDQTIQGKRNRSNGIINYRTFAQYEAEQLGTSGDENG